MPSHVEQILSSDSKKVDAPPSDGSSSPRPAHKNVFDIMMRERELMNNANHVSSDPDEPPSVPVITEDLLSSTEDQSSKQNASLKPAEEQDENREICGSNKKRVARPKVKPRKPKSPGKGILKTVSPPSPTKLGAKAILNKVLKHTTNKNNRKMIITDFFSKENKPNRSGKKVRAKKLGRLKPRRQARSMNEVVSNECDEKPVMENGHVTDSDVMNKAAENELCGDSGGNHGDDTTNLPVKASDCNDNVSVGEQSPTPVVNENQVINNIPEADKPTSEVEQLTKIVVKKTPKARKSFKSSSSEPSEPPVLKSETATSQGNKVSVSSRSNMTFKLTEVESALGIKRRSLSKIDSKTLDKIILEKAHQKKINSPVKLHSPEKHPDLNNEIVTSLRTENSPPDAELVVGGPEVRLKRRYRRRRKMAKNQWTRQKRRIHPVHRTPRFSFLAPAIQADSPLPGDEALEESVNAPIHSTTSVLASSPTIGINEPPLSNVVRKKVGRPKKRKRFHRSNSSATDASLSLHSMGSPEAPESKRFKADNFDDHTPSPVTPPTTARLSTPQSPPIWSPFSKGSTRQLTPDKADPSHVKRTSTNNTDGPYVNTPNGLMYPVTPQKSQSDLRNTPLDLPAMLRQSVTDSDASPLCCCAIEGTVFPNYPRILYCQAIDTIDNKTIGCGSKVPNQQLLRPSSRVPYLALCSSHRKLLQEHKCCATCGHFCSQGTFYKCSGGGGGVDHFYHLECVSVHGERHECPHCAQPATHTLSLLEQPQRTHTPSFLNTDRREREGERGSRMGSKPRRGSNIEGTEEAPYKVDLFNNSKLIYTLGVKTLPEKEMLTDALTLLDGEKGKKLRTTQKSLHAACKAGELERVLLMLREGVDVNQRCSNAQARTGLHGAAEAGRSLIAYILMQAGADIHICDSDLQTPLMLASQHGHYTLLNTLLQASAQPDAKNKEGMTALHLAAKAGEVPVLKSLLSHPLVDINVKDDGGWTPVIWAAEHQHLKAVQYLLEMGANPALRDNEDNTCLHWAAFSGSADISEMFLNSGCEVNTCNEHGDAPLLLLLRGGDSTARNNRNETPASVCPNPDTATRLALEVNMRLRNSAVTRQTEQPATHRLPLLFRDISYGREANCVAVINTCDSEPYPTDFTYVMENVETVPMNVNRTISSLQSCRCGDRCGTVHCVCSRSSVQCWYDKEGRLIDGINLADPPLIFECNKGCRCWANCQNRVVQLGVTSRLEVFRTRGRGWGCRATQRIIKGSFVCEYIGELISDAEADRREDDSYLFDLDNKDVDTYCVDARRYGNVARFINHLCQPNLVPVKVFVDHQDLRFPRICFFASRDIMPGEELGFDYGEKFWIIKWKQFTCECGSPMCRFSKDTIHKTIEDYRRHLGDDEAASTVSSNQAQ